MKVPSPTYFFLRSFLLAAFFFIPAKQPYADFEEEEEEVQV